MRYQPLTDVPPAELQQVLDDVRWEGLNPVPVQQPDGRYTVYALAPGEQLPPGVAGAPAPPPAPPAAPPAPRDLPEGEAILAVAKRHLGQPYGHASPDYADPFWTGPMDCAEFASYCAYRAYGIEFGVRRDGPGGTLNAYTGYWRDDARKFRVEVPVREALATAGALVLRFPPDSESMGHIGICLGDGRHFYEAAGKAKGIVQGDATARGRTWHTGLKLPGVAYGTNAPAGSEALAYRFTDPPSAYDQVVEEIQDALRRRGFLTNHDVSGVYDERTSEAVSRLQDEEQLVVDGEVALRTGSRLLGAKPWAELEEGAAVLGPATAKNDLLTLARTVYGEARGEADDGREAVAHVVMNRVRSPRFRNSIAGVCLQPRHFSCWNLDDPNRAKIRGKLPGQDPVFDACFAAAERVVRGAVADNTGGALHYCVSSLTPSWVTRSPGARQSAAIGRHVFWVGIA